jgi:hypothetical protein
MNPSDVVAPRPVERCSAPDAGLGGRSLIALVRRHKWRKKHHGQLFGRLRARKRYSSFHRAILTWQKESVPKLQLGTISFAEINQGFGRRLSNGSLLRPGLQPRA